VEKQGFFDGFYSEADGLPDRSDYPAEHFGKLSVTARRSVVVE
jgi:hypothetical protein